MKLKIENYCIISIKSFKDFLFFIIFWTKISTQTLCFGIIWQIITKNLPVLKVIKFFLMKTDYIWCPKVELDKVWQTLNTKILKESKIIDLMVCFYKFKLNLRILRILSLESILGFLKLIKLFLKSPKNNINCFGWTKEYTFKIFESF